jgi:hypothetical protein
MIDELGPKREVCFRQSPEWNWLLGRIPGGSNSRRYVWVSVGSLPGVSEPSLSFHHDLPACGLALWRESAGMAAFLESIKK